jgi:GNAT superfamily N-acetyltransferase
MVKTASGATAVQIVYSSRRGSRDIEHIGSAHDDAELELLAAAARRRLAARQAELDLGLDTAAPGGPLPIIASRMGCLLDAVSRAYCGLGFDQAAGGDEVFRDLVLARIIEPVSKLDSLRAPLPTQLGYPAASDEVDQRFAYWLPDAMSLILVAERSGRVVGCLSLHAIPYLERTVRWAGIESLVVDQSARGRGTGRSLIAAAEAAARPLTHRRRRGRRPAIARSSPGPTECLRRPVTRRTMHF